VNAGRWEPHTLSALRRLLAPGRVYVDVGAWIGPTVLAAAAFGAEVHTYEPDPLALDELRANLDLNPALAERVTVNAVALGDRDGAAALSATRLGNSMSSLATSRGDVATVPVLDIGHALDRDDFARADVVKVDIEGGEYLILPALTEYLRKQRPVLFLSLHTHHLIEAVRQQPLAVRWPLLRYRGAAVKRRALAPLAFYRHWHTEREERWREVSPVRARAQALRTGGMDFLLSDQPVAL
jgi:FkbM family methyltransferase